MVQRERALLFIGLVAIIATAIVAAYLPGLSSVFHFDDRLNLDGLETVADAGSAIHFVFSGFAGPTGRPLSLLSFVPHAAAWPDNLRPFLGTNIAIHLLNGFFVGLIAWLLARHSPAFATPSRAHWAALAVAAIWLALPLLASSSLFIVQRMTTLAALLVFSGLSLHLLGRKRLHSHPRTGIALMTVGAFVGLLIGPLAKENALVYPLLVLALDRTLFAGLPANRVYRLWRIPFIMVPAALILTYMLYRLINPGGSYDQRHFDLTERLLTQGVILFDYLRLMLLPFGRDLGPFHDHYPIYGGFPAPLALIATLFWVFAALLAIARGPRWPIPAFAVLWFLGAHFFESTWLPLELYFEHRNYLPALGIILAIVLGLGQLPKRAGRLVYAGFSLYAIALTFALFQVTSLWGYPRVAAEFWWDRNPESPRASHFLANYHLQEGFPLIAARILDETASKDPTQLALPLQSMALNCVAGEQARTLQIYASIVERAPDVRYVNRAASTDVNSVESILEAIVAGQCRTLDFTNVMELADAYLKSPVTRASDKTVYNYYVLKSRAAGHQGNLDAMMEFVATGLEHYVAVETARQVALVAEEQGRMDVLLRIHHAMSAQEEPRHPLKRREWRGAVSEIEDRVERLRASIRADALH